MVQTETRRQRRRTRGNGLGRSRAICMNDVAWNKNVLPNIALLFMLFIYNRILLIFLLNAVSNCTLHAFQVYFPHVLFSPFFVILHYHCIHYVFKYGILCISRHVLWKPAIKIYYYYIILLDDYLDNGLLQNTDCLLLNRRYCRHFD